MGFRKGDLIRHKSNKVEGIVVGFKTREEHGHWRQMIFHCTYSPYNGPLNGTIVEVHNDSYSWDFVNRGKENE